MVRFVESLRAKPAIVYKARIRDEPMGSEKQTMSIFSGPKSIRHYNRATDID